MQLLIVEDEAKIANLLRRGLREEGYAVDLSKDGEDALFKFEINDYDLLIMDILLPKKDGLAVCREVRNKNTDIPILLLTARGTVADRVTGLQSGADDYLVKPFSFDELIARVQALLRRNPKAEAVVLGLADLSINTATREVRRGGHAISLTAREYGLLDYLLRNQGVALSKTQILDHVWDYNYDGLSNILETYIKYLRKKLQVTPTSPSLIHTVRGYGYMLKETRDV
ncbi:MAG: response regulator transcription factor [Candidatus Saccharimonadales bacterium]